MSNNSTTELSEWLLNNPRPERLDVLIVDASGVIRGKRFPGADLEKIFANGVNFPISLLFCDARGATADKFLQPPLTGDPDTPCCVIPGSLKTVPWKSSVAQLMLTVCSLDKSPHELDPRTILQSLTDTLAARDLFPVVAMETEFYLLDPSRQPPVASSLSTPWPACEGPQVYAMEPMQDAEKFITAVETAARAQQIPLTSILCEYGTGQFEINMHHSSDVLQACDDFLMLKRLIKLVARQHGMLASYMALPIAGQPGSGTHIHCSLQDSKQKNQFAHNTQGRDNLAAAIGGIIAISAESLALLAPNINSFRRLSCGGSYNTGQLSWGENHRGVAIRIPASSDENRRLEHRLAGADVNPYLLATVVLAGIVHGLDQRCDPGPETIEGQAVKQSDISLPIRWNTALDALANAAVLPKHLSKDFLALYHRAKTHEEENYFAEIPDRDFGWYLRTI